MSISHHRDRVVTGGRNRKARPKTFKTEAAAKVWAQNEGIKSYDLVHLKAGISKKIKIVAKK